MAEIDAVLAGTVSWDAVSDICDNEREFYIRGARELQAMGYVIIDRTKKSVVKPARIDHDTVYDLRCFGSRRYDKVRKLAFTSHIQVQKHIICANCIFMYDSTKAGKASPSPVLSGI